jgi:prefoldin subunit 5
MKRLTAHILTIIGIVSFVSTTNAQTATPVAYLSSITNTEKVLSQKYLSYMSAASHGRNMKRIEKKRADLIETIDKVRSAINDLPSYNGDKSVRDSAVQYVKTLYSLFNEDYAKLVNMEEIAEQSYDAMEAYLMAQQKAGEKLKEAAAAYDKSHRVFAKNNNINLIESSDENSEKLQTVGKVQDYYNDIYLIFFKAYKQEYFFLEAMNAKNTNGMEQNRTALLQYATEGLEALKSMKGYNSDKSVETACRKVLEFYRDEAEKDFVAYSDFLLKAENFDKVKSTFDNSSKGKADVDTFNKAVADINKASEKYNNSNQQMNSKRNDLTKQYEETVNGFMDTHMPYAN